MHIGADLQCVTKFTYFYQVNTVSLQIGQERFKFLATQKMPSRIRRLAAKVECHSDDEGPHIDPATNTTVYWMNPKTARNGNITTFYRQLDVERHKLAAADRKDQYLVAERQRKFDPTKGNPDSPISRRLPSNVPVDWFDPDYFNSLPFSFRARYRHAGVALPLPVHWAEDHASLNDEDFMEKYGNKVLELYKLPTDEEVDRESDDDGEDDADGVDGEDGEGIMVYD